MDVNIEVKQKIINGEIQPKKYSLAVKIGYGSSTSVPWGEDAYLNDLDEKTIRELIFLLTKRLEEALVI